jgi:hypothetical protein
MVSIGSLSNRTTSVPWSHSDRWRPRGIASRTPCCSARGLPRDGQGERGVDKVTVVIEALYPDRVVNIEAIGDGAAARRQGAEGQSVRLNHAEPAVLDLDVAARPFETDLTRSNRNSVRRLERRLGVDEVIVTFARD